MNIKRGTQNTGARSPRQLNFVWQHLMFVGPQYATCFMSLIWNTEFLDGSCSFKKSVYTSYRRPPFSAAEQLYVLWKLAQFKSHTLLYGYKWNVSCILHISDWFWSNSTASFMKFSVTQAYSSEGMNEFMSIPSTFIVWFGWNRFYCSKVVCNAYFAFMVCKTLRWSVMVFKGGGAE